MPIERVLIEYAKVQLQLIVAQEQIVALQAQIAQLIKPAEKPAEQ